MTQAGYWPANEEHEMNDQPHEDPPVEIANAVPGCERTGEVSSTWASATETERLTDVLYSALGQGTWDEYDLDLPFADLAGDDADASSTTHEGHDNQ